MKMLACLACAVSLLLSSTCTVNAQQAAAPKRIGVVSAGPAGPYAPFLAALREGLREQGWIEGHNVLIEVRYAEGRPQRLAEIAAELVRLPVDVLVTSGVPPTLALKNATAIVPIVSAAATDPRGTGLVTPRGNVAAFDVLPPDAAAKQLDLLREILPGLRRLGLVWNRSNPASQLNARRVTDAASAAALEVIPIGVDDPAELDAALAGVRDKGVEALFVVSDPRFTAQRKLIGDRTTATRLPTLCQERDYADAGCVVAYGADIRSMFRQAASYVDRILKGTPAAELPVGPPTPFQLAIHAGSARAMQLSIPPSVLRRADAVLE